MSNTSPLGMSAPVANAVHAVSDGLDSMQSTVAGLQESVPSALNRAAAEADALARKGIERARHATAAVRDKATQVSDSTVGYIKDEPLKAVLIAAAVGAVAAAIVGWAARSRSARDTAV